MKRFFVLLIYLTINVLRAQQPIQYSLYFLNPSIHNPAVVGTENAVVANAAFRRQWSGLDGAPLGQNITVHLPVYFLRSGAGLKLENTLLGARRMTQLQLQWALLQKWGDNVLGIGVGAGVAQMAIDFNKLRTPTGEYLSGGVQHNDPYLNSTPMNVIAPMLEAGVYFKSEKWHLGIGGTQLLENAWKFQDQRLTHWQMKRNVFAQLGTKISLNRSFQLHTAALFKSDFVQHQLDLSLYAQYDENITLGAGYRGFSANTQDAIVLFAGFKLNPQWKLFYAYDWTLSALATTQTGTHEFLLKYDLGRAPGQGRLPPIIYHPRF